MTRTLRLNPIVRPEVSLRNVFIVGLVCIAGGESPPPDPSDIRERVNKKFCLHDAVSRDSPLWIRRASTTTLKIGPKNRKRPAIETQAYSSSRATPRFDEGNETGSADHIERVPREDDPLSVWEQYFIGDQSIGHLPSHSKQTYTTTLNSLNSLKLGPTNRKRPATEMQAHSSSEATPEMRKGYETASNDRKRGAPTKDEQQHFPDRRSKRVIVDFNHKRRTDFQEKPQERHEETPFRLRGAEVLGSESRNWLQKFRNHLAEAPDFFQTSGKRGLSRACKILRSGHGYLPLTYARHCEALLKAVERNFNDGHQFSLQPFVNVNDAVREINRLRTYQEAKQEARSAGTRQNDLEGWKRKITVQLTAHQYDFLCTIEPLFAALTTIPHPVPMELVESTLSLIRTTLLRHHVLKRLSSVQSVSDNSATRYCATLTLNCRRTPNTLFEQSAPECLYKFVRASLRQHVARSLLEALKAYKFLLSLNICFIVAVDFLGGEGPKCPLQWEDIKPLFDNELSLDEHERLVPKLISKLEPWLIEVAAIPIPK